MLSSLSNSPSVCPIDPQVIYRHLRLLSPADYVLADAYANVATELAENYLSRYLLNKSITWTSSNECRPGMNIPASMLPWEFAQYMMRPIIDLPRPASSITSVVTGIWGQSDITLVQGTDYVLDLSTEFGRLKWISDAYFTQQKDHLQVTFTSGFGPTNDDVPIAIRHAILLITGSLFENRGDSSPEIFSMAVENLLASYRFVCFG